MRRVGTLQGRHALDVGDVREYSGVSLYGTRYSQYRWVVLARGKSWRNQYVVCALN